MIKNKIEMEKEGFVINKEKFYQTYSIVKNALNFVMGLIYNITVGIYNMVLIKDTKNEVYDTPKSRFIFFEPTKIISKKITNFLYKNVFVDSISHFVPFQKMVSLFPQYKKKDLKIVLHYLQTKNKSIKIVYGNSKEQVIFFFFFIYFYCLYIFFYLFIFIIFF